MTTKLSPNLVKRIFTENVISRQPSSVMWRHVFWWICIARVVP